MHGVCVCVSVCVSVCVCVVEKNDIKRRLKEYWECQKGYSRMRELKKDPIFVAKTVVYVTLSRPFHFILSFSIYFSSSSILFSEFLSFSSLSNFFFFLSLVLSLSQLSSGVDAINIFGLLI